MARETPSGPCKVARAASSRRPPLLGRACRNRGLLHGGSARFNIEYRIARKSQVFLVYQICGPFSKSVAIKCSKAKKGRGQHL